MNREQMKLVFVKDIDGGYTAYVNSLPEIIVQVDRKEDAAGALSRVFNAALRHQISTGNYYEFEIPLKISRP